jgi:hypothetical protein
MAKRYYNLEKETKAFLKRMEETRGVLPDSAGVSRVNDYIVKRKGSGLFFGNRDKSSFQVKQSLVQRISVASNSSLLVTPSWEMVAWIFPTSSLSTSELISKAGNDRPLFDFSLRQTSSTCQLNSSTGASYVNTSSKTFTIGSWQFYNFGRDNSTSNLFLSRNLDTAVTVTQATQASSSSAFVIGDWSAGGRQADAIYDGVGRWSRLLTTDQRSFLYNTTRGVSYLEILAYRPDILVECVSYWQLNEPSGIRYDWHGSNHMSPINNPLNSNSGIIEKFY